MLSLVILALVSAQAAAQCGGHDHAACPRFMSNGFCTNTSRPLEFRQRICGRGCGLCLADCHDTSKLCPMYARTGFCDNAKFAIETKRSMCMKTCFCDKRTTTTLPPGPDVDAETFTGNELVGPAPVPVVPGPVPVIDLGRAGTGAGPQPVPVAPAPVPVVPGPAPVPIITGPDSEGPLPVVIIEGGSTGPLPVPDLTGSDQFPAPAPVPVVVPTRVLVATSAPDLGRLQPESGETTIRPRRQFTTCGILKDDTNSEVFVVNDGVSMDLARHPFNDRATSVFLLPDCEMDVWTHVGQIGDRLRFYSSSEHTFKLTGSYRQSVSSVACRCN